LLRHATKVKRLIFLSLAAALYSVAAMAEEPRALTLTEAIQLALDRSPDLGSAQQRLAAARAALRQADAAFYPRVRVSENYAASDNPVQAFMMTLNQRAFSFNANFNHPENTENLNTTLLATYPLYNGGSDLAARQAARLGAEARAGSLDAVRNELEFEVTRSFYTIGKARRFLSATEAAVDDMGSNVSLASDRFVQGAVLKSDLLDADVRLAEARENLVLARNALGISESIFRNVLGVGETGNVTAVEVEFGTPPGTRSDTLDVSQRPELLAAEKVVAAAERQVRAAVGGHLPRVNAFGSYDLDSGNAQRFEDSWVAGVSVELDVFDGFLTRGKVAEARANLDAAREELRRTELALELEAKKAQLDLQEVRARLEASGQAVSQAEESVQITRARYGNGLALLTQLLDAETALTSARQRRAAAEADCEIDHAALNKALGHGWKE
jgi:outer membrane protein TolC